MYNTWNMHVNNYLMDFGFGVFFFYQRNLQNASDTRSWGPPMRMLEIFTSVDTFKDKKKLLGNIWIFLIKKG